MGSLDRTDKNKSKSKNPRHTSLKANPIPIRTLKNNNHGGGPPAAAPAATSPRPTFHFWVMILVEVTLNSYRYHFPRLTWS
jgi:hypothetical protein